MYNFPIKCLGSIFRCTQPKQRTDQHSMWAEEIRSILCLKFSCQKSSPLGASFELVLPLRTSQSSPDRQEQRDVKQANKQSDMCMSFLILWKRSGFQVDLDRRKSPTHVREDQSHRESFHCISPLCTFVFMFQYGHSLVSVCFLSILRVSFTMNDGQSIPLWVFQCQSLDLVLDQSVLFFQVYRDGSFPPLCPMY